MRNTAFIAAMAFALSSCSTGTAPQIDPAQLQKDLALLKAIGCVVEDAGAVAAPIIAVTVDPAGQRIASAVDQVSGRICSVPSPAAS